jgi:hypothetical protein
MRMAMLVFALAISCFGWLTAALLWRHLGNDEGAGLATAIVGMFSLILTAPIAIDALVGLGVPQRMRLVSYVGALLASATPALALFALNVPNGVRPSLADARGAAAMAGIYALIGVASYPFARRGGVAAALAALISLVATWAAVVTHFG